MAVARIFPKSGEMLSFAASKRKTSIFQITVQQQNMTCFIFSSKDKYNNLVNCNLSKKYRPNIFLLL